MENQLLGQILGLGDLDITRIDKIQSKDNKDVLLIHVKSKAERPLCPNCGSDYIYINNTRAREIRDMDILGCRVILKVWVKNYECQLCGKTFTEQIAQFPKNVKITPRFKEHLGSRALSSTYEQVAMEEDVSPTLVANCFKEWICDKEKERNQYMYAPRVLGLDECHLAKERSQNSQKGNCCVFVDIENGNLLDITKDREKDTVKNRLLHMNESERIKVVIIDFCEEYRTVIYETLGNEVSIVVDRYHVIQKLVNQLMRCWKKLKKNSRSEYLKNVANYQSLLRKNSEDLNGDEKRQLGYLFAISPGLREAYYLKERFRKIYTSDNRAEAEEAFENWVAAIPEESEFAPFRTMEKIVRQWHKEIFNYFDFGRVTNAVTERLNGIIKKVNRQGNGYSFDMLRAKMLHYDRIPKSYHTTPKEPIRRVSTRTYMSDSFEKAMDYNAKNLHEEIMKNRIFEVQIEALCNEVQYDQLLMKKKKPTNR